MWVPKALHAMVMSGMTLGEIHRQLVSTIGAEASEPIPRIDQVSDEARAWASRPLELR